MSEQNQHPIGEVSLALRQAAEETASPEAIVEDALERFKASPDALYQDNSIQALKVIRQKNPAHYERICLNFKGHKTRLDRLTASEREDRGDSDQTRLIELAQQTCTLGHDPNGRSWAIMHLGGVRQVWYVDDRGCKEWLRAIFFEATGRGVSDQVLSSVVATLGAVGSFNGDMHEVHIRCAKHNGAYVLDLCNSSWQVVLITERGWQVQDESVVLFTRTQNMRALPTPEAGGDVEVLWKYANVAPHHRILVLAWLLESLRPDTPFPILEISGEQGAAKSSTQRWMRDLIDPNKVALRGRPKAMEEIYIASSNSWMVSFENLSHLSPEQQDALCTVSTGGGYATRQYYTNGDEFAVETKRPVMLNGIHPVATQPDLIERLISIEAPTIAPENRQDEQRLAADWQRDYPAIFSGLLDLFVQTLNRLPSVQLERKYRMADFQKLGEAMAQSMGHPAGYFSELYGQVVSDGIDRGLESYGVANALQVFLGDISSGVWEGTMLELKGALDSMYMVEKSAWPKSPRGLSAQLKRLAPGLRKRGILIEHLGHSRNGSRVKISRTEGDS